MKKILLAAAFFCLLAPGCKNFSDEPHMKEMLVMQDSIFKAYPAARGLTVNIQNHDLLVITIGSKKLAKADDATRQKMAAGLGAMALRIIGRDAGLEQEKLIITPDEHNVLAEPADGIVTTFSIDSLAKIK